MREPTKIIALIISKMGCGLLSEKPKLDHLVDRTCLINCLCAAFIRGGAEIIGTKGKANKDISIHRRKC